MELEPIFREFVDRIRNATTYHGNRMPESVMRMIEIEIRPDGGGVLAPYWFGVFQRGRGPRKSNKDHGLVDIIYNWMLRHNKFKSVTKKGRINEAKSLTWYINKYGNKQFRSQVFIDIYKSAREDCINKINQQYSLEIDKITKQIL